MKILKAFSSDYHESSDSMLDILKDFETIGKIATIIFGLSYVIGLIIFGVYYSNLHIRSIELFRVRYFFVGFYFCLFMVLYFGFPLIGLKRRWQQLAYGLIIFLVLIFFDKAVYAYASHLWSLWILEDSYYKFTSSQASIIWGRVWITVILFFSSLVLFRVFLCLIKQESNQIFQEKKYTLRILASVVLIAALLCGLSLFLHSVFPYIPDALGGGQAPLVALEFKSDTPFVVTSNFDITATVNSGGFSYWAKLVYADSDSLFLQEAYWFSSMVYEIRRDEIELIRYAEYNPVEIGSPYLDLP